MENKSVICAASFYNKKCYFEPLYETIPDGVQLEIIALAKGGAELTEGIFTVSITENGEVVFTASGGEADFDFDDIGAGLIVNKLISQNRELIKSIQLWHALFVTKQGKKLKDSLEGYFGKR